MMRSSGRKTLNRTISCLLILTILFTILGESAFITFAANNNTVVSEEQNAAGQNEMSVDIGGEDPALTEPIDRDEDLALTELNDSGKDPAIIELDDGGKNPALAELNDGNEDSSFTESNDGGEYSAITELITELNYGDKDLSLPDLNEGEDQSHAESNDSGEDSTIPEPNNDGGEPALPDSREGEDQSHAESNDSNEEQSLPETNDDSEAPPLPQSSDDGVDSPFAESTGIQSFGILNSEEPIILVDWYMDNDGVINWDFAGYGWGFGVLFRSLNTITSIEYSYSLDGSDWQNIDESIIFNDFGLEYVEENQWGRWIIVDFSKLSDGQIFLRATATDEYENTLSVEQTVLKDVVAENVQNLTIAPNEEGYGLVLSWTNPEDTGFVEVYRYWDYGDGYEDWYYLGSTEGTSYIDYDVYPYREYTYMVVAYDIYGNSPEDPPTITGTLEGKPIYLTYWYLSEDGVVNMYNKEWFYIETEFVAEKDIISIDYMYSSDQNEWYSFDDLISWDSGLQYYDYYNYWYRGIEVDLSSLTDGTYYIKVTAEDSDGNTLSEEREFIVKTVAGNVQNLTIAPNEERTGLVLSWTNPEDTDYVEVLRYWDYGDGYGDWYCVERTYGTSCTDYDVYPYREYTYMVVAYDIYGNASVDPPTITGSIQGDPIYLIDWYVTDLGVVTSVNREYFYIDSTFAAEKDIVYIEYMYSSDRNEWYSLDDFVHWDTGLEYYTYENYWMRAIEADLSFLTDGTYYIKVTAEDSDGNILSEERELIVKTVAENVRNLTVTPNDKNNALIIKWENAEEYVRIEIYKSVYEGEGSEPYWNSIKTIYSNYETSYTDTNVFLYKTYIYKVVTYDNYWNSSANEPTVSGKLNADDIFTFYGWYLTDENFINAGNVNSFSIEATFAAQNKMTGISFNYSTDGENWVSLEPLKTYDYGFYWSDYYNEGYRETRFNLSSLPDGDIWIQAVGNDVFDNSCSESIKLRKDATPPENVTDFSVQVDTDNSALVLSWVNPAEDFSHVIVQRRMYSTSSWVTIANNINDNTYTNFSVTPGLEYEYRILTVDGVGNVSSGSESKFGVIPVERPVCYEFVPVDGEETNNATRYYSATFIDSQEIKYIYYRGVN